MKRLRESLNNYHDAGSNTSNRSETLATLLENVSGSPRQTGNKVEVLHDGDATFDALFNALEEAQDFIHLQYYIFEKGKIQDKLYQLFKRKIEEGVEVRLLYDSFGSFSFRGKRKKRFKEIGVVLHTIMPIRFGNLLFSLNYRNHRKIVIVDGKIGFTGGVNISDKYISKEDELGRWRDIHVMLKGPVVNRLHLVFLQDLNYASEGSQQLFSEKYLPNTERIGDSSIQIVSSGPDSKFPGVMMQYVSMVNSAKEKIFICNPYFIPDQAVLHAIGMAALRGVEVNLLVPGKSDSVLAKYGMYSNFEYLLNAGVNIHVRNDFTHSKLLVVDDYLTSIGSGNFDYRSFEHNFETNTLIYDEGVAQEVLKDFKNHMEDANLIDLETFEDRSVLQKLLEGIAKLFSPIL